MSSSYLSPHGVWNDIRIFANGRLHIVYHTFDGSARKWHDLNIAIFNFQEFRFFIRLSWQLETYHLLYITLLIDNTKLLQFLARDFKLHTKWFSYLTNTNHMLCSIFFMLKNEFNRDQTFLKCHVIPHDHTVKRS